MEGVKFLVPAWGIEHVRGRIMMTRGRARIWNSDSLPYGLLCWVMAFRRGDYALLTVVVVVAVIAIVLLHHDINL